MQQSEFADVWLEPSFAHHERQFSGLNSASYHVHIAMTDHRNVRICKQFPKPHEFCLTLIRSKYPGFIGSVAFPSHCRTFFIYRLNDRKVKIVRTKQRRQFTSDWKLMVADNICYVKD
jgi:hypothetical protein